MNTPVTGSGQRPITPLPVRGNTGPLTAPDISGTTAPVAQETQPAAVSGTTPVVMNQTQTYDTSNFTPDGGIQVSSDFTPEQQTLISDAAALLQTDATPTEAQRTQLNALSRSLGFKDLGMLQHHLRNLSPEQRQSITSNLRTQLRNGMDGPSAIKTAFETTFRSAINGLFTDNPRLPGQRFPTPVLSSKGHSQGTGAWNSLALASVFNGLATINQTDPERFAAVARNGPLNKEGLPGGLVFVRRNDADTSGQNNIFDRMVESAMVAHADEGNHEIKISDNALYADSSQITNQVVDKLDLISRMDPGGRELTPRYLPGELNARGLARRTGEQDGPYNTRMRAAATGDFLQRYAGGDWNKLQDAVNFIIRYKGLRDPAVVSPPIPEISINGRANDPDTLATLQRMGPENMQMVIARMEQRDGVTQMQRFLRATVPGADNMRVDGYIGPETKGQTQAFQASLALNTIKERIEDDPNLPEQRKVQLINELNADFKTLGARPSQALQVLERVRVRMNNLTGEQPSQLAPHTRQALVEDLTKVSELARTGTFNRTTAQYLVSNWFNVMDSGHGRDMAEQLVVHEAGHIWERALDRNSNQRVFDNWARLFSNTNADTGAGTNMVHTNTQDYTERLGSDRASSSDYGSSDAREDFAEAGRVFAYDPQRLMRRSLMKFLFMNSISGNRFDARQVQEMARECGYSDRDISDRLKTFLGQGANDINFSINMNQRLQNDYEPLRRLLAEPVAVNFSPVPGPLSPGNLTLDSSLAQPPLTGPRLTPAMSTPTLPLSLTMPRVSSQLYDNRLLGPRMSLSTGAANATAAPAQPNQGGWMFERLSERYRDLDTQLRDASLAPERRAQLIADRNALISDFVQFGPGNARGLGDVAEGNDAFVQSLSSQALRYGNGTDTTAEGRAVVAALSIYRATGRFNPQEHPAIKQLLPDSFSLMMRDPGFQTMLRPGSANDSTMLLTGSLEQLRWYEQNQATVQTQLGEANVFTADVSQQIQGLGLTEHLSRRDLPDSSFGPFSGGAPARISESAAHRLLARPEVQSLFADREFELETALPALNQVVNSINRTSGQSFGALSMEDLKLYMLMFNASGSTAISGENLMSFMLQRQQSIVITPGQVRQSNAG